MCEQRRGSRTQEAASLISLQAKSTSARSYLTLHAVLYPHPAAVSSRQLTAARAKGPGVQWGYHSLRRPKDGSCAGKQQLVVHEAGFH